MRWFRRATAEKTAGPDTAGQDALAEEVRHRFGTGVQMRYHDQAGALTPLLDGDTGLLVGARILRDVADEAHAQVAARVADLNRRTGNGYVVDRCNYRPLWRQVGSELVSPLFALRCGFHPYIHVTAAAQVVGGDARRCLRLVEPDPLLRHIFEVLDLTLAGWEFGRVPVDTDAARLAARLIAAAREVRAAMPDPPPLPVGIRELMRRNNTTDVHDPTNGAVVGGINVGGEMRPAFLT
jgi:hypothetical protein